MSGEQRTESRGQSASSGLAGNGPTAAELERALVAGIDRLHAERGALVALAKAARLAHGVASEPCQAVWRQIERVTHELEQAEEMMADRRRMADEVHALPLLRDPAEEMPDADTTVVAVIEPTDDDSYVESVYLGDRGWCYARDPGKLVGQDRTLGWMHIHEAVEVLRKAVRHG